MFIVSIVGKYNLVHFYPLKVTKRYKYCINSWIKEIASMSPETNEKILALVLEVLLAEDLTPQLENEQ